MEAEEAVRTILADDASVADLVSARIYPGRLPQGVTLPAIVYQRISAVRLNDLSGPSGFARPRVQLDLWASTYSGVKALARVVRQALDGYSGEVDGFGVADAILDEELDLYEPGVDDYRVVQDYFIWHGET